MKEFYRKKNLEILFEFWLLDKKKLYLYIYLVNYLNCDLKVKYNNSKCLSI